MSLSASERARAWLAVDPDPVTRAEIQALLDGPVSELEARFDGRLQFGTAGLRAELGAGPLRMNRVVVRQTAAAVGRRLLADSSAPSVVIGYDARYNSAVFALDSSRVLEAMGVRCQLFETVVPTPLLAFAVRHLGAAAGIQVTASHNPPADNGYKVYWSDGAQIIPPLDADIEALIDEVGLLSDDDLADDVSARLGADIADAYLDAIAPPRQAAEHPLDVVYTPLHGVGWDLLRRALRRAGYPEPHVVAEQVEPDPDFPTVDFPNPEEPGALDLAFRLASEVGADAVIANDPDADRLAVAIPIEDEWLRLSGDQVGWLLADYLLAMEADHGEANLVVSSIVSSRMLGSIAARYGARWEQTLTGFKWIVRPAIANPDMRFVFGYEEALGYAVNDVVLDKDGISAALVMLDLLHSDESVVDRLARLAAEHGQHVTAQWSFRVSDAPRRMQELRAKPPESLAGLSVTNTDDLPEANLLTVDAGDGARVRFRPSGTEPKLKVYAEVVDEAADLAVLEDEVQKLLGE